MNCASNIITANFSGGKTHATTARVYQWSRGIELCITGADNLPQTFKAHFSVQKRGGVATTIVGIDERVDVPNVLFTIGKDIHVWLGASETEDDAEILYTVDIPVAPAPMPEYYDAEDTGVFDAVVEQVADYAATATAAANSAGASATAAAGSASAAAASASSAAGSAGAAEQARADAVTAKGQAETAAQTATEKAQQTAQNASQAALDAGRAESAAERAESAETGAVAAKTAAEAAAQNAAASAATANEKATLAGQSATAAAGSASAAAQSAASIEGDVQIASQKASEAQTAAGQAVTAKEAAQTAQQGAETAATNAGQSASTATAKASEAATSASNAAQSKTDAEAAAARAEQAAATLTVDDALSNTSTNPVQNKVITAEITDVKTALQDIGYTASVIPQLISKLNVPNDGTQYASGNNYDTYAIPVKSGETYVVSADTAADSVRFAFTQTYPANGVSCSYIDNVKIFEQHFEFSYTATENGYLTYSYWRASISTTVKATVKGYVDADLYEYDLSETVRCVYLNIVHNGTSYVYTNGYRTYFFPVEKGVAYHVTIARANATTVLNWYRFAYCTIVPRDAVPATFIYESGTYDYTASYDIIAPGDGYIGISAYKDFVATVAVARKGVTQRLSSIEERFPVFGKNFEGELLTTKKQTFKTDFCEFNPVMPSGTSEIPQDIACYNGTLFTAFNGVKKIMIQSMATGLELGSPQNDAIGHADSIMFSDEFYDANDDYPLLYVCTNIDGKFCAFRITTSELTLVKTYKFDTSVTGYYTDMVLDSTNKLIYTYGYTENRYDTDPNGTNYVIFCCFDMKDTTVDDDGYIVPAMLYKKKLPFIMTLQGSTFFNGRMWMVSSDYTQHNTNIYVISPDGIITNVIGDFGTEIKDQECEGITFFPDGDKYKMFLLTGNNRLHIVEFAN